MDKAVMFIDSEITNALLSAGLQANLQGFQYLREAIMESIKHPSLLQRLTKKLYPMSGELHNQSGAVVERSMRHVIDVAYRADTLYGLTEIFKTPCFNNKDKPCNGNFIALIVEIVKKNLYQLIATTNEKSTPDRIELVRQIQEFFDKYSKEELV